MSSVIADTSPLDYLIPIGAAEILPGLYGQIQIPTEVVTELTATAAPAEVAAWIHKRPDWLEVRTVSTLGHESMAGLDSGERAAILLALASGHALLVMDDSAGRREAAKRGIETIGTLGVLRLGALRGLIDLPSALSRLLRTNFRVPAALVESLISEDRARRS